MGNETETKLRNEMRRYLFGMGIYPTLDGFENLMISVMILVKSENRHNRLGKIYEAAGRCRNKSAASVERSIRTLIMRCESLHTMEKLNEYFGYEVYRSGNPMTAGELVHLFATKLMLEMR